MWRDLVNKDKIRRGLLLALYLILTVLLQNTAFARFRILGVHALILPAVVVAVAMFHGALWGGVFGLIAGLLGDMGFPETTVLFLTLLPLLGFAAGMLSEHLVSQTLPAFLCVTLAALLLIGFVQAGRLWVFHSAGFGVPMLTMLKQAAVTLPFSIPFFYISRAASRRARRV